MNPNFTLYRNHDQGPGRRNPIHRLHGCSGCRKRRRFGAPVGHAQSSAGCGAVGSESGSGGGSSGAGHRCFGENYVQEILDKAPQLPEDIEWHFVGHLQSNKAKLLLAGVPNPNLALVEGVDNEKIANHLDRAVSNLGRNPLKVLIQVNTSGEVSKSGIDPSGCVELAKHVKFRCPNLEFSGLMTIGMPEYTSTKLQDAMKV